MKELTKLGLIGQIRYMMSNWYTECVKCLRMVKSKAISEQLHVPRSLPNSIKYANKWKHISSRYKIPKPGSIKRIQTVRKSWVYTDDQIRQVCKLLADGKSDSEISKTLEISAGLPASIRHRKSWTYISSQYDIPLPNEKNPWAGYKDDIMIMLQSGEKDIDTILRKFDLPDNRMSRKYIALLNFKSKKQGSSTIENTGLNEKDVMIGK